MTILKDIDFGNEAGDDVTDNELEDIFQEQDTFKRFLDFNKRLLIFTGKKGIGKSILLKWLNIKFKEKDKDSVIIYCRGADLTRNQFRIKSTPVNPNEYIHDWQIRLCAITNRKIAELINFAITDDEHTIVETAELQGFKQKNFVGGLLSRVKAKIASNELVVNKETIQNEIEILKRIQNRKVIFIIDDLDSTFQNSDKELIELSSFFSACRYMLQDFKDIYFRVTLRTDVWPIIRRYDESLDKIEQYIRNISWSLDDFRSLLFRRINFQLKENGIVVPQKPTQDEDDYFNDIISHAFENRMQWGDKDVFSYSIIYTLSYKRPRWAIQLCKLAQQDALKKNRDRIYRNNIDTVWGEYGYKRISDLVTEHKHQCSEVEELIMAFRNEDRQLTRDKLFIVINNKISNHATPVIEGRATKNPLDIARFLYRIGFIVARSVEKDGNYEHYHYDEMPDFLSTRTSNDFNVLWEIHPCYREALEIKKINESHKNKRNS